MRARTPISAKLPARKAQQATTGRPPARPGKAQTATEPLPNSLREAKAVPPSEPWQSFFRRRIESAPFVPYDLDFDRDSPEIAAHIDREEYIKYYSKGAGEFWTRLCMNLKPDMIVELGTAFGIRTNLLGKLNPGATLISVDNLSPYPLNDDRVETGYIARLNRTPFQFVHGETSETVLPRQFNLCYIDACHSPECVARDTAWAWENRNPGRFCIVWDDYDREGVATAVRGLCEAKYVSVQVVGTQAWVGAGSWMEGMA